MEPRNRQILDLSINVSVLLVALTILIGGAMKWQKFEDDLRHETELRIQADNDTQYRVNQAHTIIGKSLEDISTRLTRLVDEENARYRNGLREFRDRDRSP